MKIAAFSIRRHVLAFMLSAVMVLFGVLAYQKIGVDRYPNIEQPIISVSTSLTGATPEVMDVSVTQIIESAVNSVPGIDGIESTSQPGRSNVRITFNLDKNIDVAFNEVQVKVNQAQRRLPDTADPSIVSKTDANGSPVVWLALTGDRTEKQLHTYATTVLKKQLETVNGVGEVLIRGRGERVIRVALDPVRLAAMSLTPQDVRTAFGREHLQAPGGVVVAGQREFLVNLDLEFKSVEALKSLVVAWRGNGAIRLSDVAQVLDGEGDLRSMTRFNAAPGVLVGLIRIANTNTVAMADAIIKRVDTQIRPSLPPGITLTVATNDSLFVLEMVKALKDHLIEGTLLAALIVWLFLRNWRSTLIIALAIPVSLLGAIALMYFLGYTFNTVTLLALLLLIGVVVDDAIVVLENIYRLREAGEDDPFVAAEEGSQQVVFAVIAATLSLVAIFIPVVFLSGIVGRLFNSFALVVSFGVLVSLFVSVTLTPMLCSRFLVVEHQHGPLYRRLEAGFIALENTYRRLLGWALSHRKKVMLFALLMVALSAVLIGLLKTEFLPEEDESRFMVSLKTPIGASIHYTNDRTKQAEAILQKYPEISSVLTIVGGFGGGQVNQTNLVVRLKPKTARSRSQSELLADMRKALSGIPGVRAAAFPFPRIGETRGGKLQFAIVGPSLAQVGQSAQQMMTSLAGTQGIGRLDLDLELELPQLNFDIDRTASARLGVSTQAISDALNLLTAGVDAAKFSDGDGERYNIRLKAADEALTRPDDLKAIYLRSSTGELVRLDALVKVQPALGPTLIARQNLQYAANLKGSPSLVLAEAVTVVDAAARDVLPLGYRIEWQGEAKELAKSGGQVGFVFGLASLLLYMILASQFNSFAQPAVIMLAEPLAVVGGLLLLWLTGHTLNVYSMIGLILLIGLVAKNAILLVDVTNQFRAAGKGVDEALMASCPLRLRPVLMTSLTVVLAMLPASFGLGAGAETNGPLAVAVIGGIVSSTLLTLVVVPAAYSLLENALARGRG